MNQTPEIEITKDPYADAQAAESLRKKISLYAESAINYGGVPRDWANEKLAKIGATLITGKSSYQVNVPVTGIYGRTITAYSRAEAAEKFAAHIARVARTGRITTAMDAQDSVYQVAFPSAEVSFASGPEDPPATSDDVPDLEGTRKAIRAMLMEGVTEQGWGHSYAADAAVDMGLEPLPPVIGRTVKVPVSGTVNLHVMVFEDATDDDVQRVAASTMKRIGSVSMKPDEIGTAV